MIPTAPASWPRTKDKEAMTKNQVRVAFFGVGPIAQPYLNALARRADVALTAVCDTVRRAAEQTAAGWGARVYLDCEAMLDESKPEALWICVPPRLQDQVVYKAIERRIPFFVSPPGALDFEPACQWRKRAEELRLVTTVGFATRHTDVVQEAREYIGANLVPLALAWWLRPAEAQDEPDSERTAQGLLWNDACRLVDALCFFCGGVTRVEARTPANSQNALVLQLAFATGGVGVLTCAGYPRPEPRVQVELLGDGWSLELGGPGSDADQLLAPLRLVERDRTTALRCLNQPQAEHAAAFLEAVVASAPEKIAPSYAEALCTLAVCNAAAISARESRPVDVVEAG
jgi:predicted dehydrogenase